MPGSGERLRIAKLLRDPRVAALAVGGALGLLILLTVAAFAVDQGIHRGKVTRNVSVGGRNVSSASKARLVGVLAEVDQRYATTEVVVSEDSGQGFTTDAGSIGLRVDPAATVGQVLAVGRTGSLPGRWWSWLGSFASSRRSDLALSVDREAVARLVADQGGKDEQAVTEASIQLDKQGKLVGVAGKPGRGIDPGELADDLMKAADEGTPIKVKVRRGTRPPRFSKSDADSLARRAETLVQRPLPLVAETTTGTLSIGTLRSLLSSVPGERELELRVDEESAANAAEKALTKSGTPALEPTFKVDLGNVITLVPGTPGRGCCGPEAGKAVSDAILNRPDGPVTLTLVDKKPKLTNERAGALGVKEEVSSYATKHVCCQPRVTNIHRIADLVRGQIIAPGESFSINAFVGPRTTEKGFVVDHVIEDGRFAEDVGGGVSQFATTLFNAAWFAGLEFGEYQSHSLYISRYPKGRDATLGFPHPDLVIKNPSPYGVVIWPTYTNNELRVTLYSTKWVDVKTLGQDTTSNGSCTVYLAKRERTFLDGRVVNDLTKAQYRAAEGQNCGADQPTPETTTTKVGTPTSPATTVKPPASTAKPPATTATTKRAGTGTTSTR
ncbi:MAG: VanW family protein [Acidimicrobiales bacterium]